MREVRPSRLAQTALRIWRWKPNCNHPPTFLSRRCTPLASCVAQRQHHYELAFEHFLRTRRIPYVAVDEARKAVMPTAQSFQAADTQGRPHTLKSFDFVIYGSGLNLLIEVKGRKAPGGTSNSRLECWVTMEDVESLGTWQTLFGQSFAAAFVFIYWCEGGAPAPLFDDSFDFRGRSYCVRAILVDEYAKHMRIRSPRWGTVHIPSERFQSLSRTLVGNSAAGVVE